MASPKKFRPRSAPSVARRAPGTDYRPPGSPQGASRRSPVAAPGKEKASLNERYNRLEQNMLRNLEMMREHREHTANIKQNALEQTEKVIRDLRSLDQQDHEQPHSLEGGRDAESPGTLLGHGHMRQRCAALEEHCFANGKMLHCHRTRIDEVHAFKRAQAAERGERYEGGPAAKKRPSSAAVTRKAPNIWEDQWWMQGWPPTAGATALSKTRAATQASTFCHRASQGARASAASSTRGAAIAAALRKGEGNGSCVSLHTDASDPMSDSQGAPAPVALTRNSTQAESMEVLKNALGEEDSLQEDEATTWHAAPPVPVPEPRVGWSSSRPPSAGSLKARTRALEEAAKRNKEMLASNRQGIETVARLRHERREKLCSDFARDMRVAMQVQPA